jgi:hypothetical protein
MTWTRGEQRFAAVCLVIGVLLLLVPYGGRLAFGFLTVAVTFFL